MLHQQAEVADFLVTALVGIALVMRWRTSTHHHDRRADDDGGADDHGLHEPAGRVDRPHGHPHADAHAGREPLTSNRTGCGAESLGETVTTTAPPTVRMRMTISTHDHVLIIDDHELVGTSLMLSLRSEGLRADWRGNAGGEEGILADVRRLDPGLVLLDLDLGRDRDGRMLDGVHLVAPLIDAGWRVLVLSGSSDRVRIGGALADGALAWVPKNAPLPALLRSVRAAAQGRPVMAPERRQQLIDTYHEQTSARSELRARLDKLTQREREVLAELAQGHRAQAVAERFVVSLATVRTQIRAILVKLEVSSQLEAVALYRRASGR